MKIASWRGRLFGVKMTRIGITLGDPSGIGYEVTAKALLSGRFNKDEILLIGSRDIFFGTARRLGLDSESLTLFAFEDLERVDGMKASFSDLHFGEIQRLSGLIALNSVKLATHLAIERKIDAICTAPIHRNAILMAGSKSENHRDIFSEVIHTQRMTTIYELETLRTLPLSGDIPMRHAFDLISTDAIKVNIALCDSVLRQLGFASRRIGVASLNPHAGEDGLIGDEELKIIKPAVDALKESYDVAGPIAADSIFHQAQSGKYDIVLSLYHDQAHIPLKTLGFNRTVAIGLGLPFLRVNPNHGPGLERGGKGIADETNMLVAIHTGLRYAPLYCQLTGNLEH